MSAAYYQTGNWNTPSTWTSDPSGTLQNGSTIPNFNDNVIILTGRTVSLTSDITVRCLNLTINSSGFLNMSTFSFTESKAEAKRLGGPGIVDYLRWVCHWRGLENHRHLGEELPKTENKLDLLSVDFLDERNLLFGTPDEISARIEEMIDVLNLQTLLVWSHFPGVEHEVAMRSVKLFTDEVMPRFKGRVGLHQAAE